MYLPADAPRKITCDCPAGYRNTFTFVVLHRMYAHRERPALARAWVENAERNQPETLADVHELP